MEASGQTGELFGTYIDDNGFSSIILNGLEVNVQAIVHKLYPDDTEIISKFTGWDGADCNGETEYSGPYNYTC